jgi:hypothetical protein
MADILWQRFDASVRRPLLQLTVKFGVAAQLMHGQ